MLPNSNSNSSTINLPAAEVKEKTTTCLQKIKLCQDRRLESTAKYLATKYNKGILHRLFNKTTTADEVLAKLQSARPDCFSMHADLYEYHKGWIMAKGGYWQEKVEALAKIAPTLNPDAIMNVDSKVWSYVLQFLSKSPDLTAKSATVPSAPTMG